MNRKEAESIADQIIREIFSDRKLLKETWRAIEYPVRREIRGKVATIVQRGALNAAEVPR